MVSTGLERSEGARPQRSSKTVVGSLVSIFNLMRSHCRIVSREARWSYVYIERSTLAVVITPRPCSIISPTESPTLTQIVDP